MKALLVVAVVVALAALAQPRSPAADPPPAGTPGVKQISGPLTSGNLTVFLIHGPDAVPG